MFAADTNVYLDASEDPHFRELFTQFILHHQRLVVSSVVVAEVLLGAKPASSRSQLVRAMTLGSPAQAPTAEDWAAAAVAVSRLELPGGTSRSFWNDALLAAQCSRLGMTLITSNLVDFKRLHKDMGVRFVAPFPE